MGNDPTPDIGEGIVAEIVQDPGDVRPRLPLIALQHLPGRHIHPQCHLVLPAQVGKHAQIIFHVGHDHRRTGFEHVRRNGGGFSSTDE